MAQSPKSQLSSRFARRTLAESSLILAVCLVTAVVVMQIMNVTSNDVDESGPASPVVEPPAIADSAFMIRDGKFDCSTIFDQASLTQLVESGIAYIPEFNRLTDKSVSTGADGRIICERAVSVEDGVQFCSDRRRQFVEQLSSVIRFHLRKDCSDFRIAEAINQVRLQSRVQLIEGLNRSVLRQCAVEQRTFLMAEAAHHFGRRPWAQNQLRAATA